LNRHSVVIEFTVYSLCPNGPEENSKETHVAGEDGMNRLLERAQLMNPDQIQAIRAFLVFVLENAGDAEWLRPFLTRALEQVWRSLLENWLSARPLDHRVRVVERYCLSRPRRAGL